MKQTNLRSAVDLLREGQVEQLKRAIRKRWNSTQRAYGLQRDLNHPFAAPEALIPLTITPAHTEHLEAILAHERDLDVDDAFERASRRRLADSGLGTCWAAVTDSGEAAYIQWLFTPSDCDGIATFFGGCMPELAEGEALLEGAYTAPGWRGKRVMAAAMARIAMQAQPLGARRVITFVGMDNPASLKGCARAGFAPYTERVDIWRRFRHRVTFTPLPADTEGTLPPPTRAVTPPA